MHSFLIYKYLPDSWRYLKNIFSIVPFVLFALFHLAAFTASHAATASSILDPSPSFTPVFKFAQSFNQTAEKDPDDPDFHIAVSHGTTSITITGSMAGIQPEKFTRNTEIGFELGNAQFLGTLGEGGWFPGQSSASFELEEFNDEGDWVKSGTVTCTWGAKSFTIIALGTTPDALPVLDVDFPDPDFVEFDPNDETKFTGYSVATVVFATGSGERRIYLSGKNTFSQKSFGSAEDKEVIDLNAFSASGSANYVPPRVSIVSPTPNLKTNVATVTVQIQSPAAEEVEVRVGDGDFVPAVLGEQFWEAEVDLAGGANLITALATDGDGLQAGAAVVVNYVELAVLTVSASDNGTVSEQFRGTTEQELGAILSIKAIPSPGFVFAEWTRVAGAVEEVISTKTDLSYLHDTPGVELKARFVLNPFLSIAGKYTLYSDFSTDADPSSLRVAVSKTGVFSGKLFINGKRFLIKGQLATNGTFEGITLKGGQPYKLAFDLPKAALGRASAALFSSNGTLTSNMAGNRAVFSATNPVLAKNTGVYTALLTDASPGAESRGYARWTVASNGVVRLAGVLDDGNKFSAGANLDGSLRWVFNASLTNKGHLFGSVHSTAEHLFFAEARCRGGATKISPKSANFLITFFGEKFTAPAPNTRILPVFDSSNGKIDFQFFSAALNAEPASGQLTISSMNKLDMSPDDVDHPVKTLKINKKTGSFAGSFLQPATGFMFNFSGVFLPESKQGFGLFFGPDFSGKVQLTPADN